MARLGDILDGVAGWLEAPWLDLAIYGGSALAAAALLLTPGVLLTYHLWAWLTLGTYAGATLAAALVLRLAGTAGPAWRARARVALAGVVAVGVVVVPLAVEVWSRARHGPAYAQDETFTTERAAIDLLHGHSPYAHLAGADGAQPRRFPYLPLLAVFGVPHAVWPASAWSDARVMFAVSTLAVAALALACWPVPAERRLRVFQVLVVLPTGALYLVTGGDDIPVLSLMLLAVVLAATGRSTRSALAISAAALMKSTAWPLFVLLALRARPDARSGAGPDASPDRVRAAGDGHGASRWGRWGRWGRWWRTFAGYLVVPVAGALLLAWDGPGLIADTVLFPLGVVPEIGGHRLSVHSTLAEDSAGVGLVRTGLALAVVLVVTAWLVVRHVRYGRPASVSGATLLAAVVAAALLVLAPTTRPGLWAYPVNLLAWGLLVRVPVRAGARDGGAGRAGEPATVA